MKKLLLIAFLFVLAVSTKQLNAQTYDISLYAGNGTQGYSGDGGQATAAELGDPFGIAINDSVDVYIADGPIIRMVNTKGIISTFAGNGTSGYSGDGGQATAAELLGASGVAVDNLGNVYIADEPGNRIRKVNTAGVISTIAGNGESGYSGDGGQATTAKLQDPIGVTVDVSGNVYISDLDNNRIRKVNINGVISTIAGNGTAGYSGNGGEATAAELDLPWGIAVDGSGNVFFSDYYNNVIRKVNTNGIISTFAGNGYGAGSNGYTGGYSGDGGQATAAELYSPEGIALDDSGNLYISDFNNGRFRKVNTSGIISTFAGNGTAGYSGDGGSATAAELLAPNAVASNGSYTYVADYDRIRKICLSPATPGAITGETLVCLNSSQTYSITPITGATSYTWTLPTGWTGDSTGTSITVTAGMNSGNISVTANNDCGLSPADTLSITVQPPPPTPDTINGNTIFSSGSYQTYSVEAVPGAASYTWTLPNGWTGSSTDTSITVLTSLTGCSGTITITANDCGGSSSPQTLNVKEQLTQPRNITGEDTLVCPGSSQMYSIPSVVGATSYTWTLPFEWTGSSTDTSITVTTSSYTGNIYVTSNNACGSSLARTLSVAVQSPPPMPGTIEGNSLFYSNTYQTYTIIPVMGATTYAWTLPKGWTGSSTDTSITVFTTSCSSGIIGVEAGNDCGGWSDQQTLYVSEEQIAKPGNITGDTIVCQGSSQIYSIASVMGATNYTWTLPFGSGWTGTSTDTSITVTVGTNSGSIYVTANDSCESSPSQTLAVIALTPPPVSICYVTVDTESTHNIIIWNKTGLSNIDSFKVYFYNSSSQWQLLAELPFAGADYYIDTNSINNPNANTVRYCLTDVDSTCEDEESISTSTWQSTLFIVNNGSGTFSWGGTGYLIEDKSLPVTTYVLYRDDLGNGEWEAIDSVSGTQNQMTDPNYSSYQNGKWRVAARLSVTGCPVVARSGETTTSYSNRNDGSAGIDRLNLSSLIDVYPNPVSEKLSVVFNQDMDGILTITDVLGRQVHTEIFNQSEHNIQLNLSELPQGIYLLRIESKGQNLVKKIVKL